MSQPTSKPAYTVTEEGYSSSYATLNGPDGFECALMESEDRTWGRDLAPVVRRLNEQAAIIDGLSIIAKDRDRAVALAEMREGQLKARDLDIKRLEREVSELARLVDEPSG